MATRAVFLYHKYAVLFVLEEMMEYLWGFLWLMVFNYTLLFAAVITLHTLVILLGKLSFQFSLEVSTEALLCEFEPMQRWLLK